MPKEYGRITDTITEEELAERKYDIVFINRIWENNDLIELRDKYGFKLVVDVDDYWILNHEHLMFDGFNATGFASKLIQHMRAADLVTNLKTKVSSNNLAIIQVKLRKAKLFFQWNITHKKQVFTKLDYLDI